MNIKAGDMVMGVSEVVGIQVGKCYKILKDEYGQLYYIDSDDDERDAEFDASKGYIEKL